MFSLVKLFVTIYADSKFIEVTPTEDTLKEGQQDDLQNPLYENLNSHKMVPVEVRTTFANPSETKNIGEIPEWLLKVAEDQSGKSQSSNDHQFNMLTETLIEKFPGFSNDPNDKVHHHAITCEMQQVGSCAEGFIRINKRDFEQRTRDEMKELLPENKRNNKVSNQNKVIVPGNNKAVEETEEVQEE